VLSLPAAFSLSGCGDQPGESAAGAGGGAGVEGGDTAEAAAGETRTAFAEPLGVQLYSVRNELDEDLEGTLRAVREAGFTQVETYSLHEMTPVAYRALLDDVGLDVESMHADYERAVNDTAALAEEARVLGSPWVVVPWIPHEAPFSETDMNRAIGDFSRAGQLFKEEDLRFAYHAHGYEFHEAEDGGTLFDRFMRETQPGVVDVEMDVFWIRWPGQDPIALIERYPGRFPLLHLKDMRRGTTGGDLTGQAPLELQVPVGEGLLDTAAIIRAAEANGAELYFIEYEHTNALDAIRSSREYVRSLEF
jgi:sugar phosphate isomerase/epimerase